MSEFIQHLCQLDMFRTSSVHHQERFVQAVFADFGMWKYAYYSDTSRWYKVVGRTGSSYNFVKAGRVE